MIGLVLLFLVFFCTVWLPFIVAAVFLGLIGAAIVTRITGCPSTWVCWVAFPVVSVIGTCMLGYWFISSVFFG